MDRRVPQKRYWSEKVLMNLPENARQGIIELAKKHDINKIILFGSRARGDNRERSDIDIAISGGNIVEFSLDTEDKIDTLLMFDVVNLDKYVQPELIAEIERDGVIIYEKV